MVKFCSDCGNAAETPFICSHCNEPVCQDCSTDYGEFLDDLPVEEREERIQLEQFFGAEDMSAIYTICRYCLP